MYQQPNVLCSSIATTVQGLEVDPLTGYITARPASGDWPRIAADQEGWAGQVRTGVGVGRAQPEHGGWLITGCSASWHTLSSPN